MATHVGTNVSFQAFTVEAGVYIHPALPIGIHTLMAEAAGLVLLHTRAGEIIR